MATTDPIPQPRRFSIRLLPLWVGVAAVVVVVASVIARHTGGGQPYHMVIEPDDGHGVVHFFQPGKGLMSLGFRLDIRVEKRQNVVLDSPLTAIPEGRIEFADTTMLPGRFKIRLGETLFDVMEMGIDVDGKPSGWLDNNSL